MPKQTVTHGGPMTPRTPDGKMPMQEFTMWVVVSPKGNAERSTVSDTEGSAIMAYLGRDDEGDDAWDGVAAIEWAELHAVGYRVARVAVVEDA